MNSWHRCRTCLAVDSLNDIFVLSEHNSKYSEIVHIASGIKIEINDGLPQQMCADCINMVNSIIKFRKICQLTQKKLEENDLFSSYEIKLEPLHILENVGKIAMLDISDNSVDFLSRENKNDIYDDVNCHNNFDDSFDFVVDKIENEDIFKLKEKCDKETHTEIALKTKKSLRKTQLVHSLQKSTKLIKRAKISKRNLENDQPRVAEPECEKDTKISKIETKIKEKIECEYCHKVLTSRLSLRNHYKIHTGFDVVCEHCGKKFITRRLLLMHCRAKHGYEKKDKCSFCDYRASNAEQVKIHERLHTGEKPYVCRDCGNGFHRKSSYLQHVAIHLPEKTVQCDQCPARFKSTTLMRIHKNRHRQPQYTFKCYICNSSFARRRNVVRHLQRIHAVVSDSREIERVKIS